MSKRRFVLSVLVSVGLLLASRALIAVSVSGEEQAEARRWAAAKFEGKVEVKAPPGSLEVRDKEGRITKTAWPDGFFHFAKDTCRRGLPTGEVGRLGVHVPAPAERMEAVVGLMDVNSAGCAYGGSDAAVFSVRVGDKVAFQSKAVKLGESGLTVKADLAGGTDFVLESNGVEGKRPCPQGAWAEARVTLKDGNVLWLDELPVAPLRAPYATEPQFSFTYGGKSSAELLKSWPMERQVRKLDDERTEYTLTYNDPRTGLVLRSVGVEYRDYPTVEWTLYFENTGAADTPILENIQALDTRLERNGEGEFVLHHSKGSQAEPNDYEPYETKLEAKQAKRITPRGGQPTSSDLCYFNVAWPGEGVIVALGWPGQWAAEFARDDTRGLRVQAGQELTHFKLHPGERVRTPLVALLFWKGDWIRAQNIWRRWMMADNLRRPGGKALGLWTEGSSAPEYEEMTKADEASQKLFISRYVEEGMKPDYWWMDAGWYVNNGSWANTGTWEVDPKRFPQGLRPISDYAHARGVKTHVWFELERVTRGTWLWDKHPDWLLQYPELEQEGLRLLPEAREWLLKYPELEQMGLRLLNLGNPEAREWVVNYLDKFITQEAIDIYRIDFNIDPLPFWRANDAPDRQGITEIRYATGFLAYLDELLRRHPGILVDTCASGGRRNDLETLRRALPITRTDYAFEPAAQQNITYGIALWIPFYGTACLAGDPYTLRSMWGPHPGFGWDVRRKDLDYPFLRHMLEEWRSIADYYFGDFYPLTTYNSTSSALMAWQFDRPDLGRGMVQVFRRAESPYDAAQLHLRGLEPEAHYQVNDMDAPRSTDMTGQQLMQEGLSVSLNDRPRAKIIAYRKVKVDE